MNTKLYEDLQFILRAPWIAKHNSTNRPENQKIPTAQVNVNTVQVNETTASAGFNFLAGRKSRMVDTKKQLQQQDEQDKKKIRGEMSGW